MTTVIKLKDGIEIRGHANYGKHGEDIVCSAVSALVQTLAVSVKELTEDRIDSDIQPGKVDIKFWTLSEQSRLLVNSFFLGVKGIAEAYPDNVKVIDMTKR